MPRRFIDNAFAVVHWLKQQGHEEQCTDHELRDAIQLIIGADDKRTVQRYAQLMLHHKLIVKQEAGIYRIIWDTIDKLEGI